MVYSLRVKYWAPKRASSGGLNWARHKLSKFLLFLTKFYLNYSKVLRPRQVLGYNFSTGKTLTMNDLWRYWRFLLIFHIYKSTITIETSCWSLRLFYLFFQECKRNDWRQHFEMHSSYYERTADPSGIRVFFLTTLWFRQVLQWNGAFSQDDKLSERSFCPDGLQCFRISRLLSFSIRKNHPVIFPRSFFIRPRKLPLRPWT